MTSDHKSLDCLSGLSVLCQLIDLIMGDFLNHEDLTLRQGVQLMLNCMTITPGEPRQILSSVFCVGIIVKKPYQVPLNEGIDLLFDEIQQDIINWLIFRLT